MRAVLVSLLVVALVAAAAFVWLSAGDASVPDPGPASPSGVQAAAPAAASPGAEPDAAATMLQAGRAVARRAAPAAIAAEDLADQPTACLQIVDRTERPIAGASVRRVRGAAEIAFSDEQGLVQVPLRQPEQLAIVVEGCLLRMAPTQLGSTPAAPQRVMMVPDEWSLRLRFQCTGAGGAAMGEVFARFRPRSEGSAAAVSGPPAGDAVLQRAWREHLMLAGQACCADVPVQLGAYAQDRVHRLVAGTEVRFAAAGDFLIEAASATGDVAAVPFRVEAGAAGLGTIHVALERGRFVAGRVTSLGELQPLAGASLVLQGGDPLDLVATTGADGAFRFGPLLAGTVTLHVRHGDHVPLAFGPVASDAADLRIAMQPLPKSTLRGRVRQRPGLEPIAGAQVAWTPGSGNAVTATTTADGTFLLAATGDAAARLVVNAPGFVPHAELVAPGSPFADYDLWPNALAQRLQGKLSAVLAGVVLDAQGRAVAGVPVRWIPAQPTLAAELPGRRVLQGAAFDLPTIVATGPDGAFVLETTQFGPGRLCFADAGPAAAGGVPAEAIAGAQQDGFRLQR